MKITINPFDEKSIAEALKQLEQYKKDFLAKEELFVRRLGEIGVSVAGTGFATAQYDGTNDVVVSMEQSGTRVAVKADGTTVGFIEFGAGINNPPWPGFGGSYVPPERGTYGDGHGSQKYGWWYNPEDGDKGVHTYGNPPAGAMLEARDTIIERITQIAREVWR